MGYIGFTFTEAAALVAAVRRGELTREQARERIPVLLTYEQVEARVDVHEGPCAPAESTEQGPDCAACPERGDFETLCCKGPSSAIEYVPPADPYAAMVREFHQRMGLVTRDAPSLGTPAEREERVRLMLEELLEFAGALGVTVLAGRAGALEMKDVAVHADWAPSITGVLHELADLQVTVSGTAIQFGLPLLAATREVHRANMEKTPQGPGRKPLKPEGWKPADVSKVLAGSNGGES